MHNNSFDKITRAIDNKNKALFSEEIADCIDFGQAYLISTYQIDIDLAYDCVMNVLEKLIENFFQIAKKKDLNFGGYFIQSLKNEYLQHYRKDKKVDQTHSLSDFQDTHEQVYDVLFTQDDKNSLKRCIEKLPEDHFEFISWVLKNEKPDKELLKKKYDITVNAFYQRKHRIINMLKKCMGVV